MFMRVTIAIFSSSLLFSCVSSGTYDELMKKHEQAVAELSETKILLLKSNNLRRLESQRTDDLENKLGNAESRETRYQRELLDLKRQKAGLENSLYAAHELIERAERVNEDRDRVLRSYLNRLRRLVDGGELDISIADGRLKVRMPSDVLFPSGSATLSSAGRASILQVAQVLANGPSNHFQIEGHTDTDPIARGPFKTNWHLGYGRAMSVLNIFLKAGVPESSISAASFGEHRPRADNDTPQGKQQNRRIEIVMVPDLSVIAEGVDGLSYRER
ncbi:OmpA/MotB family protein [Pseudobacteriovorax antillogorgiicola]|uniref:Chemotaxis protein MotB n=1 Tax=Pseudobacteriovorax antillogorgiicola TaxID=1513793 RepID=A0A1Y6BXD7_9BACT|nr:OmpA family protein [Pseudobacteriovorax antillogorgiicola]TCS50284.1 chemotaxis protein MotB [Pseudobacteriovorax antillogorgiicola]SMF33846.1 chemotaxis protein MotB [Pseudobacteriovorax antillogorgiicola]